MNTETEQALTPELTSELLAPEAPMIAAEATEAGATEPEANEALAPAANEALAPAADEATPLEVPEIAAPEAPVDPLAGVPALLATAIRRRGYAALTSVQRAVLEAESEGRDLRISSQTGSGKTVAIGLALASELAGLDAVEAAEARRQQRGPSVLVLVPTRELAMQVRDELAWLFAGVKGLGIEVVMGGTSVGLERRALARWPQVVVGTPGRALDHLKRGALALGDIGYVVLDESDRMLDMGFREELEAILEAMPAERRTHLVSATFPQSVRKLADRFQRNALHIEGTALGAANRDIEHVAHVVDRGQSYGAIVNLLLLNEGKRCLIFVERRVDVATLAEKLSADGFPVQPFSGELAQAQRTRTINAFRDGTMKTLVSTDVAARGIDVPDIELVIHADTPESADTYVHRSGRTGRAGSAGRSVALVAPRARRYWETVLRTAKIKADWQPVLTAAKVERELRKRFRRTIWERLDAAAEGSEGGPTQPQVDYAKSLLDGRDPAAVVAMLLEMAQPKPARAAVNVREASEYGDARGPRGGREARGARSAREGGGSAKGRSARGRDSADYVTFSINWGEAKGAAASRVLGHVCRRGGIRSQLIGAIKVGAEESRFDVDAKVAAQFEKAVRAPDARDPGLQIVRASGGPGPSASASAGGSAGGAGGYGGGARAKTSKRRDAPPGKKRFKPKGKRKSKPRG